MTGVPSRQKSSRAVRSEGLTQSWLACRWLENGLEDFAGAMMNGRAHIVMLLHSSEVVNW